jgi:ribonuclease P protein component
MAKRFGLGRKEKLKSRKQVEELFTSGKSFPVFPLRVIYRFLSSQQGELQIGVSASKRNFKKAVDRNRLKRLMREAYRLQKHELASHLDKENIQGYVFFMFIGKAIVPFRTIKDAMKKSLDQLQKNSRIHEDHT